MRTQAKTAGGISRRNLWAYPVGTVGRDRVGGMFTNGLLTYMLFTKTLTSMQFACISIIMAAACVFDALNDPVMGNAAGAEPRIVSGCFTCAQLMKAALVLTSYFIYRARDTITEEPYEAMMRGIEARRTAKGETTE